MINYESLEQLVSMDFKKMRALEAPGGRRATDEAITLFVNGFLAFFSQFQQFPNCFQLEKYKECLEKMTLRINIFEQEYYEQKYISEGIEPNFAKVMAETCCLKSYKNIPERMQYWAASDTWGNSVRNPLNHVRAVKQMEEWSEMIVQLGNPLFFASAVKTPSDPKRLNVFSP